MRKPKKIKGGRRYNIDIGLGLQIKNNKNIKNGCLLWHVVCTLKTACWIFQKSRYVS
jgi:hypothetical protein